MPSTEAIHHSYATGRAAGLSRWKPAVIVPASGIVGFVLGSWIVYWVWPISVIGVPFFSALDLATADAQFIQWGAWLAWALVVSTAVTLIVTIRRERSLRAVVAGALMSFGLISGHAWWVGLIVGASLFEIVPSDGSASPAFLVALAGWGATVAGALIGLGRKSER